MEQLALILLQLMTAAAKVAALIKLRSTGADVTPEMLDEAQAEADTVTQAWEAELERLRREAGPPT